MKRGERRRLRRRSWHHGDKGKAASDPSCAIVPLLTLKSFAPISGLTVAYLETRANPNERWYRCVSQPKHHVASSRGSCSASKGPEGAVTSTGYRYNRAQAMRTQSGSIPSPARRENAALRPNARSARPSSATPNAESTPSAVGHRTHFLAGNLLTIFCGMG